MRKALIAILAVGIFGAGAANAGPASVVSDFAAGADGWSTVNLFGLPLGVPDAKAVTVESGFISTRDTHSWNVFSAPSKFLGNKAAFAGGTLSLDLAVDLHDDGANWPVVVITDGVTALAAQPFENPMDAFTHFSFVLGASKWKAINPFTMTMEDVSPTRFAGVLGNLQGILVNADFKIGGDEYARLDNVVLTAAVPEPETYASLVVGLAMLGIARRRISGT